jgi:hypothetical protein
VAWSHGRQPVCAHSSPLISGVAHCARGVNPSASEPPVPAAAGHNPIRQPGQVP